MSGAFDGTGGPYRGGSFRAALLVVAAVLLAIAGSWLGVSWALNNSNLPGNANPTLVVEESPAP